MGNEFLVATILRVARNVMKAKPSDFNKLIGEVFG
jgi:hypothetical protein